MRLSTSRTQYGHKNKSYNLFVMHLRDMLCICTTIKHTPWSYNPSTCPVPRFSGFVMPAFIAHRQDLEGKMWLVWFLYVISGIVCVTGIGSAIIAVI